MINLIQPLTFYDKLEDQNYKMENSPSICKFLCDKRLIPFQIRFKQNESISHIKIIGFKYQFDIVIDEDITEVISTDIMDDYIYLLFHGGENLKFRRLLNYPNQPPEYKKEDLLLCSDYYHFEIKFNSGKYLYSEKFYMNGTGVCDSPITLEIQAWNNSSKNGYSFYNDFKFKAYFSTFIHSMKADITDDFDKNGYEIQILKRRVIQFPYYFAPDPLSQSINNGLAVLTAFDNFVVIENGNEYIAEFVSMESEDVEGTNLSTSIFTFKIEGQTVIKSFC